MPSAPRATDRRMCKADAAFSLDHVDGSENVGAPGGDREVRVPTGAVATFKTLDDRAAFEMGDPSGGRVFVSTRQCANEVRLTIKAVRLVGMSADRAPSDLLDVLVRAKIALVDPAAPTPVRWVALLVRQDDGSLARYPLAARPGGDGSGVEFRLTLPAGALASGKVDLAIQLAAQGAPILLGAISVACTGWRSPDATLKVHDGLLSGHHPGFDRAAELAFACADRRSRASLAGLNLRQWRESGATHFEGNVSRLRSAIGIPHGDPALVTLVVDGEPVAGAALPAEGQDDRAPGRGPAKEARRAALAIRNDPSRKPPTDPEGLRRVNVGCGPNHVRAEWWNIDLLEFDIVDQAMDATQAWPFAGLDYVYAEHFLEHLGLDQAIDFLTEAGRALRPGGRIRLSTPALEYILKTHFDFDAEPDRQADQTFGINRAFRGWGHQFIYSRPFLEQLLLDIGYAEVTFHRYGQSEDAALRGLERHRNGSGERFGYQGVLIAEGMRGDRLEGLTDEKRAHYHNSFLRYLDKH